MRYKLLSQRLDKRKLRSIKATKRCECFPLRRSNARAMYVQLTRHHGSTVDYCESDCRALADCEAQTLDITAEGITYTKLCSEAWERVWCHSCFEVPSFLCRNYHTHRPTHRPIVLLLFISPASVELGLEFESYCTDTQPRLCRRRGNVVSQISIFQNDDTLHILV